MLEPKTICFIAILSAAGCRVFACSSSNKNNKPRSRHEPAPARVSSRFDLDASCNMGVCPSDLYCLTETAISDRNSRWLSTRREHAPRRPCLAAIDTEALRVAAAVIWIRGYRRSLLDSEIRHRQGRAPVVFSVPTLDKLVHGVIFVVLAILWMRVSSSWRAIGAIILGGAALGIITELGQLVPIVRRDANIFDLLADFAGVVIGIAAAPLLEPWLASLERRLIRDPDAECLAADR